MMDTMRVDICYRPIRIAWAIRAGDFDSFRRAVRYSYALWGGCFNPILVVDREEEASRLIDLFRVDFIVPIGESAEVKNFPQSFPHLIHPFFNHAIFNKGSQGYSPYSQILDVHNTLAYLRDKQEWKRIKELGIRLFTWQPDDPLADVFLIQYGGYPSVGEVETDYQDLLLKSSEGCFYDLEWATPIPSDTIEYIGISRFSHHGLMQEYKADSGWDNPGFFIGSSSNFEDLVCHWNLRSLDIPIWFVDPQYTERYAFLIPAWEKAMRQRVANHRYEWNRRLAIWTRQEDLDAVRKPFGDMKLQCNPISAASWNGLNLSAPTMCLGDASILGVMGVEDSKPKVTFALSDKPFCNEAWTHLQHLVASISFLGGLYGDDQHTFQLPYVPELNEFYARNMHFIYNKLRVEPGRIGLLIDATERDCFLKALPVDLLMSCIFDHAGYSAKLSSAGLITRQLIRQLGGAQKASVFKIPGVRRLIKTFGLHDSFTKKTALQMIGSKDPDRVDAKFSDHSRLFIERRQSRDLTTHDVFEYLVEKGLFRIGADLICPSCQFTTWIPLDTLQHKVVCALCGHSYNASRQLAKSNQWHYRRSSILQVERNAEGAIPVILTLQQLDTSFHGGMYRGVYSPSLELSPKSGSSVTKCEIDFVWIIPEIYPHETAVILGECKDKQSITIDDITNLKRVADSFPSKRFKTFVVLSKLASFSTEEIENARTLNIDQRRAILLTHRELEPYHIYERTEAELGIGGHASSPEEMAEMTEKIYFR